MGLRLGLGLEVRGRVARGGLIRASGSGLVCYEGVLAMRVCLL